MATAQSTASPRAPRGKQQPTQSPAQAAQKNIGRQSQRKPRGNRAHYANPQYNGTGASPSKLPSGADPAFADSVEAHMSSASYNPKRHSQSPPSIDRINSQNGGQASLTKSGAAPHNSTATPAKIHGAYAGPTFHASPAPSALPIPKFLSRSVPAKTRAGPPTPPPDDSSDSTNSPSPIASPSRAGVPVPPRNEDSPLDMLFRADKAERTKNIYGSPSSVNFFDPANPSRPQYYKHESYNLPNGIFPIEMDGESKNAHSPPLAAPPAASRAVTDPNKVPQLRDVPQQNNPNDIMQDLFSRLSMSQKDSTATTPPKPDGQVPSGSQPRHQTPSPFHEGRPLVRSTSGPSTPQPVKQEPSELFYGNRNLSPLFQASKGDSSKRNSGLRTEITADSPVVAQGMFQDFPSIPPQQTIDPNTFSHGRHGSGGEGPSNPPRGSAPFVQPYQQSPNNRRKTPGRQSYQPRSDSYPARGNWNGPGARPGKAAGNGPPASASKPSTTMMSFVPASVAAKQHSSSTPPSAGAPPPMKTSTPSDTLALEQDLKRLLNLQMTGGTAGVR